MKKTIIKSGKICLIMFSLFVFLLSSACSSDTDSIYRNVIKNTEASSDVEKFLEYASNGKYEQAQQYYWENIYGDYELEQEIYEVCNNYYSFVNSCFLDGSMDESTANVEIGKLKKSLDGLEVSYDTLYDSDFEKIKISKNNYSLGCSAHDSQNYEKAIEYFSGVLEEDSNYASAQDYLKDTKSLYKQEILSAARSDAESGNYSNAISTLNEVKDILFDDTEIQAEIDRYSAEYVQESITQAESIFQNPETDWEKSLKVIKQAQQVLPDNEQLQERADYYMLFQPVSLFDMHVFNSTDNYKVDSETDNMGNTYEKCMSMAHTGSTNNYYTGADVSKRMGAVYVLDRKYNKLNFTVAVESGNSSVDCYMTVEVYGDGKLLYDAGNLTQNTKPENIELDVTGVSELKARIIYNGPTGNTCYIHNCREAIFAEPMLSRTQA